MTNHVVRLYAVAASVLAFAGVFAAVSAHPWKESTGVEQIPGSAQAQGSQQAQLVDLPPVTATRSS